MKKGHNSGSTLIELVVALAILMIIFAMTFSVILSFYRVRVAYDQELILQQNFRIAVDRVTDDFRQASKGLDFNESDIIISPADNAMDEEIKFARYNDAESKTHIVRYYIKTENGKSAVHKEEYIYGSSTPPVGQPITENMDQLVRMYFTRKGGKVLILLVGKVSYFGQENIISYTSLVFSRNKEQETLP